MTITHHPFSRISAHPVAHPPLPPRLEGLRRLAYNLYWSWHPRAISLFKRIDAHAWQHARNPVPVLQTKNDWSDVLDNPEFMAEYETVVGAFDRYMSDVDAHWHGRNAARAMNGPIAYFCAE